jgi:DNA-binding response OmpR family regulator
MNNARILILEDDAPILTLYSKVLIASGYEVQSATSVPEGRELLNRQHFDMLICDMRLGNERGIDLISEYRVRLQEAKTAIIGVSAESHYQRLCQQIGVDFFLIKPVSAMELVQLVKRLLAEKAA